MGDTIRVSFGPPKFTVRRLPVPRKLGPVLFEMPLGSQLLGIEAPEHDPTAILFFWACPVQERPTARMKFIVIEEGQPFDVEECTAEIELDDGTVYEEVHTHLQGVGFWAEDGDDGAYKTIHVLQIIDDEDPSEEEEEEGSDEDPSEEEEGSEGDGVGVK